MPLTLEDILLSRTQVQTPPVYTGEPNQLSPLTEDIRKSLNGESRGVSMSSAPTTPSTYSTDAIHREIIDESRKRGLDPIQTLAMFQQESSMNPNAPHGGLGQFTQGTAASRKLDYARLHTDPSYNIRSSLDYLKELTVNSGGDIQKGMHDYNGEGDPNYLANVAKHTPMTKGIVEKHYLGASVLTPDEQQRMQQALQASSKPYETIPEKPGLLSRIGSSISDAVSTGLEESGKGIIESAQAQRAAGMAVPEAVANIGTGMIGGAVGATHFIEGAIGAIGAPSDPHYWGRLVTQSKNIAAQMTYEPKTEEGKKLTELASTPLEALHWFSERASQAPLVRMFLDEDQRQAVAYAHELVTFIAADQVARGVVSSIRPKINKFQEEFTKAAQPHATNEAELSTAAKDLVESAQKIPKVQKVVEMANGINPTLLPEMRQQGRGVLDQLNSNPDNVEYQTNAMSFVEKAKGVKDTRVTDISNKLSELVPSKDILPSEVPAIGEQISSEVPTTEVPTTRPLKPFLDTLENPDASPGDVRSALQQIKSYIGKEGTIKARLEAQGFIPDEISTLEPKLKNIRAAKISLVEPPKVIESVTPIEEPSPAPAVRRSRSYRSEQYAPVTPEELANYTAGIEQSGNRPSTLTPEQKLQYVEEKTRPLPKEMYDKIQTAVESGIDISTELPENLRPKFQAALRTQREGINASDPRGVMDVLRDLKELLMFDVDPNDLNIFGRAGLSYRQKMAAQRLAADAMRAGQSLDEKLREAGYTNKVNIALVKSYLDGIRNPIPPSGANPKNMQLDPDAMPGGKNPVVKHGVNNNGLSRVPLFADEVRSVQAAPITQSTISDLKLETQIRGAQRYGESIKAITTYAYRAAEISKVAEVRDMHRDLTRLEKITGLNSKRNIANHVFDTYPGGDAILKETGRTPQTLTPKERQILDVLSTGVEEQIGRVNEVRAAIGQEPIPPLDDPIMFMRAVNNMRKNGNGVRLVQDEVSTIMDKYDMHKFDAYPRTWTQRVFRLTGETDLFRMYDQFSTDTIGQTKLGPMVAKLRELTDTPLPDPNGALVQKGPNTGEVAQMWRMQKENPGLHKFLSEWTDHIDGRVSGSIGKVGDAMLQKASSNMSIAMLPGALYTAATQVFSLVPTMHAVGIANTFRAMGMSLNDLIGGINTPSRANRYSESRVLDTRSIDASFDHYADGLTARGVTRVLQAVREGRLRDTTQLAAQVGLLPLDAFDLMSAQITYDAATIYGKEKLGLSGRDLVNFADDKVIITQGSGLRGDVSTIQRGALGKNVTQFQTFAISDMNYLINDVLHIGHDVPMKDAIKDAARFIGIIFAWNVVTKAARMNSPLPTPIDDAMQTADKGGGPIAVAGSFLWGAANPYTPIFGGMKYGGGIGGPTAQAIGNLVVSTTGDSRAKPMMNPVSKLGGVPMANTFWKLHNMKEGGDAYESLMNFRPETPQGGGLKGLSGGGMKGLKGLR